METIASAPDTKNDVNGRLGRAQDHDTDSQALWQLIDDTNDLVANTARTRLGLAKRGTFDTPLPVHIPRIGSDGRILA